MAECHGLFEKITKSTVAIIGNAPVHHSADFYDKIDEWVEKGLFIMHLPPYSPEFYLINNFWRMIKYKWINISGYLSYETLVKQVEYKLKNVGFKFCINFSKFYLIV